VLVEKITPGNQVSVQPWQMIVQTQINAASGTQVGCKITQDRADDSHGIHSESFLPGMGRQGKAEKNNKKEQEKK